MFKENDNKNYNTFVKKELPQNKNVLNDTENSSFIGGEEGFLIKSDGNIAKDVTGTEVGLNFWDKKVLYIHPNHEGTYKVISQGIIEGLRNLVREVYTAKTDQDVVNLANQIKPDLLLVLLGDTFPIDQVNAIRTMGIKTAVWFTDDPYYTDVTTKIALYYQYIFTQELSCVSYYQLLGSPQVHYLPLAVNTKYFYYQKEYNSTSIDVCFMGAGWNNRITLFDQIASYLSNKNTLIVGSRWDRMRNYHLLSDKIRFGFLSPEESANLINQSKIVINNHRSYDDSTLFNRNSNKLPAVSINPRTFEISACCAFQLSDVRQELHRYYEVGKEIETYSSPTELIEKIDYYLNHEDERHEIARRGHSKTLINHTYTKRLVTLLKVVFG
ncbi:spore maturation protein CgeB [Paenibacillus sp. V4I3]|uniref:CgeB family protein n=1 Tax=Paenibacillus sp. V4I3 TaxID=3042305 RepID=UPI002781FABA|nr:glycosyltransferase [Paenibacillus sp. V4I3]MDQ0874557.1 spore maturation protein CgeB [Paenibacillus sp. V4I3]